MLRLAICGIYYTFWIYLLPHLGKYRIRQELLSLEDESSKVHSLVKVPLSELDIWDAEHDVLGQKVSAPGEREIGSDYDEGKSTPEKKEV